MFVEIFNYELEGLKKNAEVSEIKEKGDGV